MYLKYLIPSLVAASLLFTACGNNEGASSDGSTVTTTEPSAVTVTISGSAVDGYIRNGFVCIDENSDGECNDGEVYTKSSANGSYTLSSDHAIKANSTVLVSSGVDDATGKQFRGVLKAPYDSSVASINVTPLTTIVAAKIQQNGGDTSDSATIASATAEVAATLGMSTASVHADPVALANAGDNSVLKKALQIQKAIEIMTEAEGALGASQADAMTNVSKALAKQFNGTESNVSALTAAIATDVDVNLPAAEGMAAVASQMADIIEESNVTDAEVQAVAEILVSAVEAAVTTTVDVTGVVTTNLGSLDLNTTDVSANAVTLANVDRMLGLIGYTDTKVINDANKTVIASDTNITATMTMTEFKGALETATNINATLKAELLAKISLALTIEAAIGSTVSASSLLNIPFTQTVLFNQYDSVSNSNIFMGIGLYKTTLESNGSFTQSKDLFDPISEALVPYYSVVTKVPYVASPYSYYSVEWDGTKWVTMDYSNDGTNNMAFTINTDGTLDFYDSSTGRAYGTLKLLASNDLTNTSKSATYMSQSGPALMDVNFTAGTEYVIEQISAQTYNRINYWSDGNSSTNEYLVDSTTGTGYTSLSALKAYFDSNLTGYSWGFSDTVYNADGSTTWVQVDVSNTTPGTLVAHSFTYDVYGMYVSDTILGYAGTYGITTIDGLSVLKWNIIAAYNPNGFSAGFAVGADGFVYNVYLPSATSVQSGTMPLYDETAAIEIAKAIKNNAGLTLPTIQSLIDQNLTTEY